LDCPTLSLAKSKLRKFADRTTIPQSTLQIF
jgi:hypothetical protein